MKNLVLLSSLIVFFFCNLVHSELDYVLYVRDANNEIKILNNGELPVVEKDKISRIYLRLINNSTSDFSGYVHFFINDGAVFEKKNIEIFVKSPSANVTDVVNKDEIWFDVSISDVGSFATKVVLTNDEWVSANAPSTVLQIDGNLKVDVDTDNDGKLNAFDTDDDNDGLLDTEEAPRGTDPLKFDTDGDGYSDKNDDLPLNKNEYIDTDGDGIGNNADTDDDNDGLTDLEEPSLGTDPLKHDTDGDGVNDKNDVLPLDKNEQYDTDGDGIANNTDTDDDNDGLTDIREQEIGTDSLKYDTDGDGLSDGEEVANNTDPLAVDTDKDGLSDKEESILKTSPLKQDTDGDGLLDKEEIEKGTNPLLPDTDNDGISDKYDSDSGSSSFSSGGGSAGGVFSSSSSSSSYIESKDDNVITTASKANSNIIADSVQNFLDKFFFSAKKTLEPQEPKSVESEKISEEVAPKENDPVVKNPEETNVIIEKDKVVETNYIYHTIEITEDDLDGDGLSNELENRIKTDINNVDTDNDGLSDFEEYNLKTSPLSQDTDGDGFLDKEEIENGTNPLLADVFEDDDSNYLLYLYIFLGATGFIFFILKKRDDEENK